MKNNFKPFFNLNILFILFCLRILPNIISLLYYLYTFKEYCIWYFIVFINGKMNISLRLFNVKYSLNLIL